MVHENGACWMMEHLGSTYGATEMAVPLEVGRQKSVSERGWALQVAVRGLRPPGPGGVGQGAMKCFECIVAVRQSNRSPGNRLPVS